MRFKPVALINCIGIGGGWAIGPLVIGYLKDIPAVRLLRNSRGRHHIISTTRPLTVPAFRSVKTWLMSSNFDLWISARTLPSAANAIASARSSRPPRTTKPTALVVALTIT